MRKVIIAITIIFLGTSIYAQEAAEQKIQAGLVLGYGLNSQKMGTKLMESNGLGGDFTIGANANFSLTETIGFNTGVEFDFATVNYKAGSTPVYYYYNDTEIRQNQNIIAGDQLYELETRKQKALYLTIPTMFIFRTKFIGYMRYFGKFGLRNSFLLSNKINDKGSNFLLDSNPVLENSTATASENTNMDASNEMFFFKSAIGLTGGAEWNFSGTTSLIVEFGYYYSFTPTHGSRTNEKAYLFTTDATGTTRKFFSNKSNQNQFMLKASILF